MLQSNCIKTKEKSMRNSLKIILFAVILAIIAIFAVSCGDDGVYTSIETPNLEYSDGAYSLKVSSDVSTFDLSSLFTVSENATFVISDNESFDKTVNSEVVLSNGSNKYYVKVTDKNKNEVVYKFIIIRSKLYNVTFNTNGGSEVPVIQCEEGRILEAPVSLKPGYTLSWDYDFTKAINSDVTINAIWTANKYNITIEGTDTIVEVVFGENPVLTIPKKAGYKFTEWQYNGATFDATQSYNIDSDITIKPVYEIQKYSINYITIGGENTNPLTYTVEDEIIFKALTWATSDTDTVIHEFAGWFKDADFKEPFEKIEKGTTESIDVYAKWIITDIPEEKIETTITFNAPDYDCNSTTKVVVVGDEYTLPKLEKNGYIFTGWQTEDGATVVQSTGVWAIELDTITLIPCWTKRAYSITYILNGGVNNSENVDTYYITDNVTLFSPEKQYSSFGGWYTDEKLENAITEITEGTYGDLILYAKWDEIKVTITYNANGGQISQETQTLVLGSNYTLIAPVKLGYKFDGWFNEDGLLFEFSGILENESVTSLTAKWSLETYTVEYNLNGGNATGLKESYTINDTFALPIPTKDNKIFLGWSVNNGPIVKNMVLVKGSVGNRVYVAHWCDKEAENGVVYSISNGVATVVGYKGVVGKNVTIPAEYNGCTVVAIGNNAFSGYGIELEKVSSGSNFTTFVIPNTITRIGANAFTECDDLKIQLANADEDEINAWAEKVVVESGNDHVLDVIRGKRPAIGWKVYYKPEA